MNLKKSREYFAKAFGPNMEGAFSGETPRFAFPPDQCRLIGIKKLFEAEWVECSQYEAVTSGEGNEKEKIDSAFSSSLQSLLFFAKVPKQGVKIRFGNGDECLFHNVVFEYRNKVIGYPSSVDVVLYNEKAICFVESKLLEVVRDSNKDGKSVVGVSYFREEGVGYHETLGLEIDDLKKLKIKTPQENFLAEVKGSGYKDQKIEPISNNRFVYSEGIKQILSHLIGIASFTKGESAYQMFEDPLPPEMRHSFEKHYYLELINGLPDFDGDKEAAEKLEDFQKHFKATKDIITKKSGCPVDSMDIMTYQTLFMFGDNKKLVNEIVKGYYHFGK